MKKGQKKESGTLKNSLGVAFIGAMLSSASHATNYTPLSSDMDLARKLIDYKSIDLKDLALQHLEKISVVYPAEQENVNLLIAEIYHLQNQNRKFDEQIAKIKEESSIYDKALLLTALRERSRGKNNLAIAAYDKYFKLHPEAPKDQAERNAWMNACDISSTIYTALGNMQAANNRKDMKIKAIEAAPEDPGKKMALRKVALERAMLELSHADNQPDVNDTALSFTKGDAQLIFNNLKLNNKFTFECMVKEDFTDGLHTLLSISDAKNIDKVLFIVELKRTKLNALTEIIVSYTPDGGNNRVVAKKLIQNRDDWYQLSVSFDGSKLLIYKNGDEIASAQRKHGAPAGNVNIFIGGTPKKGAFKGSLDNIRIWDSVRPEQNIALDVFSSNADSKGFVINCNFDDKTYKSTSAVVGTVKGSLAWVEKNARRLKVLKNVEALQANTMGSDYIAGVSVGEIAHAYYLAADYKNVAATVRQNTDFLVMLENVIAKQNRGDVTNSPLGVATYYFAMAYKATAEQNMEKKPEIASKAFATALDQLSVVINKYGRSRYGNMAKLAMADINPKLDKLGWTAEQKSKYAEYLEGAGFDGGKLKADNAFRDKNYEEAIANYRQAFSSRLRGRGVGSALYNTLISYLNLKNIDLGVSGKYWEAEAVADHLLYSDPTSEEAARACQQMGRFYARLSSNKDLNAADQKKYRDAAAVWYEEFVRMRPNDEQAPQFKFLVAESQRGRLIPLQIEIKALEDAIKAEKDDVKVTELNIKLAELKLSEQGLIQSIIPKYVDIVEKYPNDTDGFGVRAARTLGQLYNLAEDRKNSSESFIKAATLITDDAHQVDVAEYYKMAGDEWMRSTTPINALPIYQRAIDTIEKAKLTDAKSKKLLEDSYNYQAWALYNTGIESLEQQSKIEQEIRTTRDQIRELNTKARGFKRNNAEQAKEIEVLTRSHKDVIDDLNNPGLPKIGSVTRTPGMSDAEYERAVELENVRNNRLKEQARALLRTSYLGLRRTLNEENKSLSSTLKLTEEEIAAANSEISKQEIAMLGANREIPVRERRIAMANTELTRSKAEIKAAFAVVEKVDKEIDEIRKFLESPEEHERVKAQADIVDKQDELRPARLRVKKAEMRLDAAQLRVLVDSANDQKIIEESNKVVAAAQAIIAEQQRQITLKNLYIVYLKAAQKAVASRLNKAKADEALYVATAKGDGKEQTQEVIKKAKIAREDYQAAFEQHLAYLNQINKFNSEDFAATMQIIENKNAMIAKKQEAIVPLKEQSDKSKRDSIAYFDKFLKLYPKSDYTARNLAFAGKIYIEFAEFEKAGVYLNQLKKDYPNSDFIKNARLDIAKSYLSIKRYNDGAKAYQEVLNKQKEYSPSQLIVMQRQLVEAGSEAAGAATILLELAIKVGDVILGRLEEVRTREPRLWATREIIVFRNAEAAFELKQYDLALKYYNQVLAINPRSSYQFRINFKVGICLREKSPADILGSLTAFNQIVRYKDNAGIELYSMTILEQAKTEMARNSYDGCNNAANTLRLIVMAFDKEDPTTSPFVQQAYYDLVQAFALMGNVEEANKYALEYKSFYPEGTYAKTISNLPAVKYQTSTESK